MTFGGEFGHFEDSGANAQAIQSMKHVGTELDAEADCAELRCAFEHADRVAMVGKGQCRAEPAKAAANNDDGVLAIHSSLLRARHQAAYLISFSRHDQLYLYLGSVPK